MAKNDAYWDKENVKIENVKFTFWDGKDQDVIAKGFAVVNNRLYDHSSS